jgi:hypothetical protein
VPSWLISAVLHFVVLLLVGLGVRLSPRHGISAERTAEVGIALKRQDGSREYYQSDPDGGGADAAAGVPGKRRPNLSELFSSESPVDPTPSLPAVGRIGPDALGQNGMPNAGGLSDGPQGFRGSEGGQAQTTLFGIQAEGWKFVYVFDRSDSMNSYAQRPLRAAKAQLLASLESLEKVHQFQVVFYNHEQRVFNPSRQQYRLAFATEQNKRNAEGFIRSITAYGSTEHLDALKLAIKLQPDVIFFLTDADEPRMLAHQLDEVQRRAGGIVVHAIQFGLGPQRDPNNFLVRLAAQNGGQHAYVDIAKLLPAGTR